MIGFRKVYAKTKKISKFKTKQESCPFSTLAVNQRFRSKTTKTKPLPLQVKITCDHQPECTRSSLSPEKAFIVNIHTNKKPLFSYCFCVLCQEAVVTAFMRNNNCRPQTPRHMPQCSSGNQTQRNFFNVFNTSA